MPKRSTEDKIDRYLKKIRRLEAKTKRRKRIVSDSESDIDQTADVEEIIVLQQNDVTKGQTEEEPPTCTEEKEGSPLARSSEPPGSSEPQPAPLGPDILVALGELPLEDIMYGPDIHPDLARRWAPILRKPIVDSKQKEELFKQYAIPQNCKLFRAPQLNPEIATAISEFARARDKKIETTQQQLGVGLTAINKAISSLLESGDKVLAIKYLSDATRILSDLHALETTSRIKSVSFGLDKSFCNLIQNCERDEMLFGSDLPEKIKASKAIEKQGSQIKSTETKSSSRQSTAQSTKQQGNWRGTSRSTNRGGRRGARKTPYNSQRTQTYLSTSNPSRVWNKPPQRAGPRT